MMIPAPEDGEALALELKPFELKVPLDVPGVTLEAGRAAAGGAESVYRRALTSSVWLLEVRSVQGSSSPASVWTSSPASPLGQTQDSRLHIYKQKEDQL